MYDEPIDEFEWSGEPLRVAILTVEAVAAQVLVAGVRAHGHEAVGVVTAGAAPGAVPPPWWPARERLVAQAPEGLPLRVAEGPAHVTSCLASLGADLILCFGFPSRVPPEALTSARMGAVNVHPSLLPRWRGPNPLAWAVRAGDALVGVSFHRMDARLDTGPLLGQAGVPLDAEGDAEGVLSDCMALVIELLPGVLERVAWGEAGEAQPDDASAWAGAFEDDYVDVDWRRPAREVHAQVRAWQLATPARGRRGAIARLDGVSERLLRTRIESTGSVGDRAAAGAVVAREDGARLVQCGEGRLWILRSEPAPDVSE